jgi:hypothetical protein
VSTASGPAAAGRRAAAKRGVWIAAACVVYLLLAGYQLGLPGLHYDEAKEAGVNAVELLTGAPTTPFRGAALQLWGQRFPLMVQDYIGSLNVYLALPILAFTGVGVPNLRALPVLTGLAALLIVAKLVSTWDAPDPMPDEEQAWGGPWSWGGVAAAWLLAVSPSFVFWSRQGIFVTNLMQPLAFAALWQGERWLATGRRRCLFWALLAAGFALYAKLLAVWIIGPWLLLLAWRWWQANRTGRAPHLDRLTLAAGVLLLLAPLTPLIWFNVLTQGTIQAFLGNAGESYYGVDNLALWRNAAVRMGQLGQALAGSHFWYLGGIYGNGLAPWAVAGGMLLGLAVDPRRMAAPLLLVAAAFAASCFTISALFITHYALLQPLLLAIGVLGYARVWAHWRRSLPLLLVLGAVWLVLDVRAVGLYHQALTHTGGLGDHSAATYDLAYYLRYNGLGAPLALDWGLDAPIRFLSANTVRPIELFGYASPARPDEEFRTRLAGFLPNPDNIYLLRAPAQTVFVGRREQFIEEVAVRGQTATLERTFAGRDGTPLYELWRVR